MTDRRAGLRVLLVDDEPAAIVALTDLLAAHPAVTILGSARNVDSALTIVAEHAADLDVVFLDVEMPRRGGFELLASLGPSTRVVFVTAYDDYAIDAFEVGARDYLLKPVTAERLARCLTRLEQSPQGSCEPRARGQDATTKGPSRRPLPVAGGTRLVEDGQILWIEAVGSSSEVRLADGTALFVRRSIASWQESLPADGFFRVSRSLIVQVARIRMISWRSQGGTQVAFHGSDRQVSLGRAATARLKQAIHDRHES